jgi:ribonuclease P protein component
MPAPQTSRKTGESLPPEEKLRRRAEYQRCYEQGRRCHGPLATIYFATRGAGASHPRVGITVTRKVGGAVARYRIKRRIREIYRRWSKRNQLAAYDILIHVKPAAREAGFRQLRVELLKQLAPLLLSDRQAG